MDDRMIGGKRWRFCDVIGQSPLEVDYRILSPYAWVEDVTFEVRCTDPSGSSTTEAHEAVQRHADPWVYAARFRPRPSTTVAISVLVGGEVQLTESIDIGVQVNTPHTRNIVHRAPRLVRAVNTTPIGCPSYSADQDDPGAVIGPEQVTIILNWIWRRLSTGLDPAWLGPDGARGLSLNDMNLSSSARETEEWARGFAELAVGSRYGGAESAWYFFQFDGLSTDGPSTRRMAERRDSEGGRSWFPLGLACQQLATLGLMLGNYPYDDFSPALNAGGSLAHPVFTKAGGGTFPTDPTVRSPRGGLSASPPIRPGAVYEFYTSPNVGGAHIGMVLRVRPDDGGWCGVQAVDTGALNVPGRRTAENFNQGTHDDPWLLNDVTMPGPIGNNPYKGLGVPYPHSPLSLSTIRSWWPLGFARLVLRKRSDGSLIYATPMLRMHHESLGFPLALYGWSLRGRPYAAAMDVRWQITIPQRGFARQTVESGPSVTMTQLLDASGIDTTTPDKPLRPTAPNGTQRLFPFASIGCDANDCARVETGGIANYGLAFPWGVRSRGPSAPDFAPLVDISPYLRGDEGLP